jgi:hypothetical protein
MILDAVRCQIYLENNEVVARAYIVDAGGRQLHTDEVNLHPIKMYRFVKKFIETEPDLFTACKVGDEKLTKIIKFLGFKEVGVNEGYTIFRRQLCH